ncbi:hypothetical protein RIF29_14591 [Crotalaria pallida]|uniref:Uncharacterized protein n=1 Tax=Crotalaria pallida TaxID=3830 RepID=A0AAN9IIF0_CROPI
MNNPFIIGNNYFVAMFLFLKILVGLMSQTYGFTVYKWPRTKLLCHIAQCLLFTLKLLLWVCGPSSRVLNCNNSIKDVPIEIALLTGVEIYQPVFLFRNYTLMQMTYWTDSISWRGLQLKHT